MLRHERLACPTCPTDLKRLNGPRRSFALTFVTVAEFLRGAYKANWDRDQQQMARLTAFYEKFDLVRCDFDIVKTWGKLSGLALQAGITVPANDSW